MREVPTFCRICEAECGIIATVEDGRITNVVADRDNPHSLGFMCTKPKAMLELLEDPERVTQPLKRVGGPGEFAPVSWEEAIGDISTRLKRIVDERGPKAFATHTGNPAAFDVSGTMAIGGLREAIGSPWAYGVNADDAASYVSAAGLQFGTTALLHRPDLWRTDFLLMIGANPWISKGSVISEPQIRKAMQSIIDRGGRVVVVDPRRTETAKHFEHVAVRPGTDAWLLLGIVKTIVDDELVDAGFLNEQTTGFDALRVLVGRVDLEQCSDRCGVPRDVIEDIARSFATAPSAVTYGRTGSCTQLFGTLNNMLINALNCITGNLNREGGSMFGWGAIDVTKLTKQGGAGTYGETRSRTLGLPMALGQLPTASLWRDITEPGDDQIRSLCMLSANPVSSSAAGGENLANALDSLDLFFSFDLYVNETNKYAHYVLPGTTFYERPDVPLLGLALEIRPALYATPAIIEKRGEVRDEWRVMNEIANRMGLGGAYPVPALRWLAKRGKVIEPMQIFDMVIRTGPAGDLFGLRRKGWSLKKLREQAPNGVKVADHLPVQKLHKLLETDDKKVHLVPPEFAAEVDRMLAHAYDDEAFPLRAIGLRELQSHNSWMHNSPRLVSDARVPSVLVHPDDAKAAGLAADGDLLEIESASGTIRMAATITDEMRPGAVAIPHGWGHDGGWTRANAAGGANSNVLASDDEAQIEPLAGMSVFSGIPIRIRAAVPHSDAPEREPVAAG